LKGKGLYYGHQEEPFLLGWYRGGRGVSGFQPKNKGGRKRSMRGKDQRNLHGEKGDFYYKRREEKKNLLPGVRKKPLKRAIGF